MGEDRGAGQGVGKSEGPRVCPLFATGWKSGAQVVTPPAATARRPEARAVAPLIATAW